MRYHPQNKTVYGRDRPAFKGVSGGYFKTTKLKINDPFRSFDGYFGSLTFDKERTAV